MTRLTVVIVSYNSAIDLDRCLASLRDPGPRTAHEVVVVDNASSDGSPALVRERHPQVRLLVLPENVGFARANNLAVRQTAGELVLFLNSDTIVPPGAVDGLVGALDAHADAAAAGPRLVDALGHVELSFGRMVGPLSELRQKRLLDDIEAGQPHALAALARATDKHSWPDWVSGACLLVRRADAEAVGLFDERFFMYLEDVDLCASLRARGRRILFVPEVTVTHLRGRSRRAAPEATERAYRRSQVAFYAKHHPRWVPVLKWYLRARGVDWAS